MGLKGRKVPVRGRNKPRRPVQRTSVDLSVTTHCMLEPERIKDARLDGETVAKLLNLKALHPAERVGMMKVIAQSLRDNGLTVTWRVQGMEAFTLSREEGVFDVSAA